MRCHAEYCFLSALLLFGHVSTLSLNFKSFQTRSEPLNPSILDKQFASPNSVTSKSIQLRTSGSHLLRRGEKKILWRRVGVTQNVLTCDGTFYQQTKVDQVAAKICLQAKARKNGGIGGFLVKIFSSSTKPFPNNNNLFARKDRLTMTRISQSFFTGNNIKNFLKLGKKDFVILAESCTSLGVVRQISANDYILCNRAISAA